nr:unnamed protein product [Callosobruchus analis]
MVGVVQGGGHPPVRRAKGVPGASCQAMTLGTGCYCTLLRGRTGPMAPSAKASYKLAVSRGKRIRIRIRKQEGRFCEDVKGNVCVAMFSGTDRAMPMVLLSDTFGEKKHGRHLLGSSTAELRPPSRGETYYIRPKLKHMRMALRTILAHMSYKDGAELTINEEFDLVKRFSEKHNLKDGYYAAHSEADEIVYKTVIELIGPVENSAVVNLCCGVGPLGLSFGKHCK